jgi:hypothetical protein
MVEVEKGSRWYRKGKRRFWRNEAGFIAERVDGELWHRHQGFRSDRDG